jgi:putative Mg2+ transporter-C (MgtC) family protein
MDSMNLLVDSGFWQLILALALGLAIGTERTFAGKTAGMRTFALVSMGSCLLVLISNMVQLQYSVDFDPLRIAAGIVTGVGFLGAGMIFRPTNSDTEHVSGLTSAAGIWVASAVGVAVGYELYAISIFATALTLITFAGIIAVEDRIRRHLNNKQ